MQNKIEGFRLSPQQRDVWRLSQDNKFYRAQCVLLLEGKLNSEALEQTIQKIVARHEILRTSFRRNPGISYPIQLIGEGRVVLARDERPSERNLTERRAEIEELAAQQRSLPFDLEQSTLLHAALVKLDEQTHLLLLCLPALCADARTLRNLSNEISRTYSARADEDESTDEPVQYVQFSEWQNELLEDDAEASTGKSFWRQQKLASYTAPALPFESRSRDEMSFEPRRFTLAVGTDLIARLDDQARAHRSNSSDFLMACWQTLLWRLTAQPDIIVGKPFDGRKYDELEEAFGLFATRIPIVGHFADSSLFSDVLKQLSDATSDASAWQEYFNWEDESSTADSSLSRQSCSIGFDYEERTESLISNGVSFNLFDQYFCAGRFKIKLNCVRKADSLALEFHYDANVFEAAHVKSIAGHFLTLVESAVGNPTSPVSELEILTAAERTELLSDFNRTTAASPLEKCIYELFEEQAARTPDQVAVVFEDERLTYAQLNARANQLAHYLRGRGVGADVCVGLCVERSLEMTVGMLGILKAGGAYAPLDPEQPRARLQYQLDELDAPVLLTQKKLLARLPDFAGEVICLDESAARFENAASTNPERRTGPQHLAYVIYTSGSTGSPKGVAVTQRNLVNYTTFICRKLRADELRAHESLNFATVSTITADLGNTCIFPPLISGGCLHVLSYEVAMDAGMLASYFSQHLIDVLKIVPSHFSGLLNSQETANILPRKFLILGGEALSFNLLERISKLDGACKLVNHYGPTESTVGSLTFDYNSDAFKAVASTVPVGRPIANTQVYILNGAMQPQPIGVAGELYIGGDGLARGYLKKSEQTAEKFVADPFANDGGSRLYRTGDLARFLPDGEVEFIGRIDHQVKVRGYRIEPGEIEAELRQHPALREALVIARDEADGHKRLIAYVVAARHSAPTMSELRDCLGQRLPAYMIPSTFVTLKSLPVTRNGKVDRAALPEPEQIRPELERSFIAPRNEVEETLAAIWCQVLGLEQVGRLNNFFELGGDSILSLQIVARANRAGLRLTPKQLFEHPTIGELAAVANATRETQFEQGAVTGSVPLTPVQRRFFERELPDPDHWNMAVMLELKRELKRTQLEKAVEHLLAQHDALRMRFAREESGWFQSNNACGDFAPVTQVDLTSLPERERIPTLEAVANTFQASLDLSDGRPLRFVLFNLGGWEKARLLVIVHHLVVDGVSWRILIEDLETACDQLACGEPVELAPKTASFKQWAERLTVYAQSAGLRRQLSFWTDETRQLSTRLPLDYVDGNNSTASARTVNVELETEETRELLQDVPVIYNTQINDVLLAALARAFRSWTGESATLVELEGHGREEIFEDIDLSRTIGWFTTHFPVLLRLPEQAGVSDSVKAIKEQLRAIPERGISYGVLRYLGDDAQAVGRLRSLPEPEVSFNYLGQFDNVLPASSLFALATESVGMAQSLKGSRGNVLRINASVTGGQLRLALTYSENLHRRETIEQLAQWFVAELRAIVAHRPAAKVTAYTPSDFPQADINQQELDRLVARIAAGGAADAPGEWSAIEDVFTLSPIQEGMLFHSETVTDSDPYFRQLRFMLRGDLNVPAFETAWQSLIERHPTLRTSFFWKDLARPHQVVRRNVKLPLAQFDWRELSFGERAERMDAFLKAERTHRFELTQSPLMRLSAIRVADDAHQLVWSYHHLIMDAWSRSLLFKEFLELYEAHANGSEVTFEPSRSYSEYVSWLRKQDNAQTEAYWRKTLEGLRGATVPRGDVSEWGTTAADEHRSEEQEIRLSAETTAALQTRAREYRLTLNTFIQGAWALLLGRYSGETDVVFGTVVSGRPVELASGGEIIGLFINTLPRRVRIEPEQTVLAWLQQLQSQQVELGQYEHSSLVQVQTWSDVPRGKSLFECVLNFGNAPVDASLRKQRQGLSINNVQFTEQSHYPLALEVAPGVEMSLRMLFDIRRFNSAIIGEMLKDLEDLLREMALNPMRPIRELCTTKNDNSLPAALLNEHLYAVDAEAQFVF